MPSYHDEYSAWIYSTCTRQQCVWADDLQPRRHCKASEVNGNFSALQTAIDNNDSRLTTVESAVGNNSSGITSLQSKPKISGNLTLPDYTDSSTGNIMKGLGWFLHNYRSYSPFSVSALATSMRGIIYDNNGS
jgi:hypothetical protein